MLKHEELVRKVTFSPGCTEAAAILEVLQCLTQLMCIS